MKMGRVLERVIIIMCVLGGLPYKKGGDARREISNEPLKGTSLGVVQVEFDP